MKIATDQTKSYTHAFDAIEDKGYAYEGSFLGYPNAVGKRKEYHVFSKGGKKYYYDGMDHFNTTIYSITLRPLDESKIEQPAF